MVLNRRRLLQALVAAAPAWLIAHPVAQGVSSTASQRRARMIGIARMINSVQADRRRELGRYVDVWELSNTPGGRKSLASHAPVTFDKLASSVDGFPTMFRLLDGGQGYEVLLVDSDSHVAIFSDTRAAIFHGVLPESASIDVRQPLRPQVPSLQPLGR